MFSSKPRHPVPVYLNVYDLGNSNSWLHGLGMGAYHSGVEVYGREYSFGGSNGGGGTGVFEIAPRSADGCVFRQQVQLGHVVMSMSDVNSVVSKLKGQFHAADYHILTRNCNVFSDAMSRALLGPNVGIPAWVNRLASVGQCCSCFLPPEMQTPKNRAGSAGGNANAQPTDKLLAGSGGRGNGDGFVAFSGSGHSMTADSKTPASKSSASASVSASAVSASGSSAGAAASASGAGGSDEKREKMRRAALDRLGKQKKTEQSGGAAGVPADAI